MESTYLGNNLNSISCAIQQVHSNNNQYYQKGVQQPYAQPVLVQGGFPSGIIVNQPLQVPNIVMTGRPSFAKLPVSTICQFCRNPMTTAVQKSFNFGAFLLCWFTGFCFVMCIQCCLGKKVGCCDAVHKCPLCGNIVAVYYAI